VIVLIPAIVYGVSSRLEKTYEASTTLQVQQTTVSSSLFSGGQVLISSSLEGAARLIQTSAVANKAARKLDEPGGNGSSLLSSISVDTSSTTGAQNDEFLTITARANDAERAADIANAFAHAVSNTRTAKAEEEIDRTIATLSASATAPPESTTTPTSPPDTTTTTPTSPPDPTTAPTTPQDPAAAKELAQQLQQLRALKASQASTTQVVQPAFPPGSASSPRPSRNAAVGFVFALLLAAGLVPMLDRLDRRLREPEEIDELLATPTLGMIPAAAFPGGPPSPHVREAFQTLRAALTYFNVDRSLSSVIITSPAHSEGKTTVAVNLAIALAQDEREVILVDGDLRRPQVAGRVGADARIGLDAVLVEDRDIESALVEMDVGGGRLRVLSGGTAAPNPAVLLGSARMRSLLAQLSEQADMLVIDTPPILSVSDAIPLLEQVSGTVLVARIDHTSRDALRRSEQVITAAGATLLGVVATGTRLGGLYGYADYGYYEAVPDVDTAQTNGGEKRKRGRARRLLSRKG
jgi:capsular exopolysaccharide synthesis family protein